MKRVTTYLGWNKACILTSDFWPKNFSGTWLLVYPTAWIMVNEHHEQSRKFSDLGEVLDLMLPPYDLWSRSEAVGFLLGWVPCMLVCQDSTQVVIPLPSQQLSAFNRSNHAFETLCVPPRSSHRVVLALCKAYFYDWRTLPDVPCKLYEL